MSLGSTSLGRMMRGLALAATLAAAGVVPTGGNAQEMNLSRIGAFESLGTGAVRGGSPPKILVDDDGAHAIVLTIWGSDGDSKVFWNPVNGGAQQSTVIHGTGVHAFQTSGQFKIQAMGERDNQVQYGFILFRLRDDATTPPSQDSKAPPSQDSKAPASQDKPH